VLLRIIDTSFLKGIDKSKAMTMLTAVAVAHHHTPSKGGQESHQISTSQQVALEERKCMHRIKLQEKVRTTPLRWASLYVGKASTNIYIYIYIYMKGEG
jgi:hypothetical protein